MSAENNDDIEKDAAEKCCANCGVPEIDDIKLKPCDKKCDLVRYCSDECQQNHLQVHESVCKERVAELRDEIVFRQPESSGLGDCPICFLPLPLDDKQYGTHPCCCKMVCVGCAYAHKMVEAKERRKHTCPFCRKPESKNRKETLKELTKRAAADDPVALRQLGVNYCEGEDYDIAFKYYSRAAELGDLLAHSNLSRLYHGGYGVEKDDEMVRYHLEEAAIAGDPIARHFLGNQEWGKGSFDRAVKHWIIAATLGDKDSLDPLKESYKLGLVSKDDLAAALRSNQAAVDATKSPQRKEAEGFFQDCSKDELAAALRAHQAAVGATETPQREVAKGYGERQK